MSYTYKNSVKSSVSDELINTYFFRPISYVLVKYIYETPITPNQITLFSVFISVLACLSLSFFTTPFTIFAGILILIKNILDCADGQLARTKNQTSREGRFLDSIGDFVSSLSIFIGISIFILKTTSNPMMILICLICFICLLIRVSYYVFYSTSYLHLIGKYKDNRLSEEINKQDANKNKRTVLLQKIYLLIYGWQDKLIMIIDSICKSTYREKDNSFIDNWYKNNFALRLSSFLGLGTELTIISFFLLINSIEQYLYFNLIVMNSIFLASIFYRGAILSNYSASY